MQKVERNTCRADDSGTRALGIYITVIVASSFVAKPSYIFPRHRSEQTQIYAVMKIENNRKFWKLSFAPSGSIQKGGSR